VTRLTGQKWLVVQTQVNAETKAAYNLLRQGFEIYLPRYLKRRSHARKIDRIPAPLFPRYVFVRIDMATQRWRSIQSTFGVSHLLFNGVEPASVENDVIDLLRSQENERGMINMDRRARFAIGDKVHVLAGAFIDSFGLFEGFSDRNRVAILLDCLGRQVRVSLDADLVAVA
jgi:transcriptional antiterminator RfaH